MRIITHNTLLSVEDVEITLDFFFLSEENLKSLSNFGIGCLHTFAISQLAQQRNVIMRQMFAIMITICN